MKKWLSKDDAHEILLKHIRQYPGLKEEPTSFEEALYQVMESRAYLAGISKEIDEFIADLNEKELLGFIEPNKKQTSAGLVITFGKKAFSESQIAGNFISSKKLMKEYVKYREEFFAEVEEGDEKPADAGFIA